MKALTLTVTVPGQKLSVCELGFQIHSGKLIRLETDTAFTAGREFTPPSWEIQHGQHKGVVLHPSGKARMAACFFEGTMWKVILHASISFCSRDFWKSNWGLWDLQSFRASGPGHVGPWVCSPHRQGALATRPQNEFVVDVVLLDQGEDNESHQPGKGGHVRLLRGDRKSLVFQAANSLYLPRMPRDRCTLQTSVRPGIPGLGC